MVIGGPASWARNVSSVPKKWISKLKRLGVMWDNIKIVLALPFIAVVLIALWIITAYSKRSWPCP